MDLETIADKLDDIENCVQANNRALRGYDGEVGLVAKVEMLEKKLDAKLEQLAEKSVTWPFLLQSMALPIMVAILITVLIHALGY